LASSLVAAAVLALVAWGPAAAQGGVGRSGVAAQRQAADEVQVQVVNFVSSELPAEIFVVPQGETRHIVADAAARDTTMVSFAPTWTNQDRFRLVAVMSGKRIESEAFSVDGSRRLRWDLKSNELTSEDSAH